MYLPLPSIPSIPAIPVPAKLQKAIAEAEKQKRIIDKRMQDIQAEIEKAKKYTDIVNGLPTPPAISFTSDFGVPDVKPTDVKASLKMEKEKLLNLKKQIEDNIKKLKDKKSYTRGSTLDIPKLPKIPSLPSIPSII
jgi:DNA repair exonuclease SbcCD ATPase subunit